MRISTFFTVMVGLVATMFTKNKSQITKNATHSTGHYDYKPNYAKRTSTTKHSSYSTKSERSRGITKAKRTQNKRRRMAV